MSYVDSTRVVLAIVVVLVACVAGAAAVAAGRRSGNWLWLLCALGMAALVAGVVGQRAVPVGGSASGPWDASVPLLGTGIKVTPVALGGFLFAAAGLSLVLFFEPARERPARAPEPRRRLEDDDAV